MINWGVCKSEYVLEENQHLSRVIGMNREIYTVGTQDGERWARLTGSFRFSTDTVADLPVVGDWVVCETRDDLTLISRVLPRFSLISRKAAGNTTVEQPLASNINVVCIVQGLDGGRNFSPRSLERYLTLVWEAGAQPLVILNKADLCEDPESQLGEAENAAPGADVLITSAETGVGIEELRSYCRNKTVVFLGPSGVGKSALTNALLGRESQATGANRDNDKRGRHTTTSSRLNVLDGGGWLIDSPGLKEVQLWGNEESVDSVFQEIEKFAEQCRFRDCAHQGEPGCAVQEALNSGEIDQNRYQSYLELRKEMAYLMEKKSEKKRMEDRKRGKEISKYIKSMKSGKAIY